MNEEDNQMIIYNVKDNYDTFESYKRNKISLGSSDMATLLLRSGYQLELLHFGIDECYTAWYVIDSTVEIPSHYSLITSTTKWLKIYDDSSLVFDERGDFEIYRAGEMGCIIRKIGG